MLAAEFVSKELCELYHVEEDLRGTDALIKDEADSSELSAALWNTALLGNCILPHAAECMLIDRAQEIYAKLAAQMTITLRLEEEDILCLALVELTKQFDSETTGGKLWDYLSCQLGYVPESNVSRQALGNKLRELLRRTFRRHGRYFAEEGQRYYTTLQTHALSPRWSAEHLLNILSSFYVKNLKYQYAKGDAGFSILVSKIARRWAETGETEEDPLRTDSLASGFRMLFQRRPHFMAAVCDCLIGKMDALLLGDDSALCPDSRWDRILLDWYNSRPENERRSMAAQRRGRSWQKIVTRRENIRPEYCLENELLCLRLPQIRLPEIDQPPVLELYQGERLIRSQRLPLFGDSLCWTTREVRLLLTRETGLDWSEGFHLSLRLCCGREVLYQSGGSLLRQYLVFGEHGGELKTLPNGAGRIYLLAGSRAQVDIPEETYPREHPGQLYFLSAGTARQVRVNGQFLLDNAERQDPIQVLLSREPEALTVLCGESACQMFSSAPSVRVFLADENVGKRYAVVADGVRRPLAGYRAEKGCFRVPMPKMPRYQHRFLIQDFETGGAVFALDYIILNDFAWQFDRPYYPNQPCGGRVTLRMGNSSKTIPFQLETGQQEIAFPLWDREHTAVIPVPKLEVSLNGENALTMEPWMWHEDLRNSFLSIQHPEDISVELILGGQAVPALRKGHVFELGGFLDSRSNWGALPLPLGIVLRTGGRVLDQILLTEVLFQPDFTGCPLHVEGRRITWEPEDCFRGPPDAELYLLLENDREEPWRYLLGKRVVEKNFPCRDGYYGYQIFLREKRGPFAKAEERLLLEGQLKIGEPNRGRWLGKELHLTAANYRLNNGKPKTLPIQNGGGIITGLDYVGTSVPKYLEISDPMPEYRGILRYETWDGRRYYFGGSRDSEDREWINPLRLWLGDGGRLYIQTANETALMINTRHPPDIRAVRIVERTAGLSDVDWDFIFGVDYFNFEERDSFDREDYI